MDSIFIQASLREERSVQDSSRRVSAPFKVDRRSCPLVQLLQSVNQTGKLQIKEKRADSAFDLAQSFRFFFQFSEFESFHFLKKAQI